MPGVDIGEPADGRQVLRSQAQHVLELGPRLLVLADLEERPAERHAGRQVGRVPLEAGAADGDRLLAPPGAAVLFREGRKRNRRRIHLDPASQFFDARALSHSVRPGPARPP
jgi:hypothetical protein